jgi:hypothetical protein
MHQSRFVNCYALPIFIVKLNVDNYI